MTSVGGAPKFACNEHVFSFYTAISNHLGESLANLWFIFVTLIGNASLELEVS